MAPNPFPLFWFLFSIIFSHFPYLSLREKEMFGRVRASPSPSPLDSLERPPSKIIKDDSLSIYEATLMKLQLGSQRYQFSSALLTEEADCVSETVPETTHDLSSENMSMKIATCSSSGTVSTNNSQEEISSSKEAMVIDTDCSSETISNSQQRCEGAFILYLFSKYKNYKRDPIIGHEAVMMESDGSASFSSFSECQSLSSATQGAMEPEITSSWFPVLG